MMEEEEDGWQQHATQLCMVVLLRWCPAVSSSSSVVESGGCQEEEEGCPLAVVSGRPVFLHCCGKWGMPGRRRRPSSCGGVRPSRLPPLLWKVGDARKKKKTKEKQEEEEDGLMWVLVLCSPGEGLEGLKALEQGGNVDESPMEQVRRTVPNTDDPSLPSGGGTESIGTGWERGRVASGTKSYLSSSSRKKKMMEEEEDEWQQHAALLCSFACPGEGLEGLKQRAFAVVSDSKGNDIHLRFHDTCMAYKQSKKYRMSAVEKLQAKVYELVAKAVKERLGLAVTAEDVSQRDLMRHLLQPQMQGFQQTTSSNHPCPFCNQIEL
ncbi:unnamed protein product [Sphagnum compactum]